MTRLRARRDTQHKDSWLGALRTEGAAFRAALSDLATPVPTCPGWTLAELVEHVGLGYEWVVGHVTRGVTTRPPPADSVTGSLSSPLLWWDERFAALVTCLSGLDEHLPAWNWAPRAKTADFWFRRMAHETSVHRWDAEMAAASVAAAPLVLAADAVAEVLDTWLPAGRGRSSPEVHGLVQLVATDVGREWFVRLRGRGVSLLDTDTVVHESHRVAAAARGTASDLALALYGRVPFDVLDVSGSAPLLSALRL